MDAKIDKWGRQIRGGWSASHAKSKSVADRLLKSKQALNRAFIWGAPKMSGVDDDKARPYYRNLANG